ncbi:MAG: hypothetical protein IKE63_04270 [Bacilli bacterium]|nr:hypothetical protein [Bacilli bacterium]
MKGNKKILTLSVLVLLLAVCFTTYAIYRSSADGEGSVNAANWAVQINGSDIDSADFDFDATDVTWTTLTGYNDTIAPGSEGYIDIAVDADGSEVDVILAATLDTSNLPTGMTATVQGGNSQTIAYSDTAGAMETTVRINIAWAGAESDTETKDGTDLGVEGTELSLPVTLTAKQSLTNHATP